MVNYANGASTVDELKLVFPELTDEQTEKLAELGRKLTPRQRRMVALKLSGLSTTDAALMAGYAQGSASRKSAVVIGSEALRKPDTAAYMRALADAIGLSDVAILRKLKEGMSANRVELSRDGSPVELGPDWQTRQKYIELALKAKGRMPDPRLEVTGNNGGAIVVRHTASLDG